MKFRKFPGYSFVVVSLGLALASPLSAITWDVTSGDGATVTSGSGSWNTTAGNAVWNNGSTNVVWSQTSGTVGTNTAVFAGSSGTHAISVETAIATTALTFSTSGYTLSAPSAQTLTISGTPVFTLGSGVSATIGSNLTVTTPSASALTIAGAGNLTISGSGARVTVSNNVLTLSSGGAINVGSGGTLSTNSQLVLGTSTTTSSLTVNDGTVSAGSVGTTSPQNIVLSNAASGTVSSTLTINSGTVTNLGVGRTSGESGLRYGSTTAGGTISGNVELNGGTLTVARVYEGNAGVVSNFNFNGGTLKVQTSAANAANFMTGLDNVAIKEGGAIIDTNSIATTIAQVLKHGGAAATDGGLDKRGAGNLILSGANEFTGAVTVSGGLLAVANNTALGTSAGGVTLATNTALSLANGVTVTGETVTISGGGGGATVGNFNGALEAAASASATWAGTVILNSSDARVGAANGGTLTLSGAIQGSGANQSINIGAGTGGTGTVIISASSGTNTYTGNTAITRGTLKIGANNSLPVGTVLDVDAANANETSTFDLNGFNQTVAGLQRTNTGGGAGGAVVTNSGASDKTITIDVAGSNSYSFGGTLSDGATHKLSLVKDCTGTQTLTSVSTYTGTTLVSEGTLLINGTLGNTDTAVSSGAYIGGDGVIGGSLALDAGAFLVFDPTDTLTVNGTSVTFGGFGITNLFGLTSSTANGIYTLIDGSADFGAFANVSNFGLENAYNLGGGKSAYFTAGSLNLVVVPEPSSLVLSALSLFIITRRRRG